MAPRRPRIFTYMNRFSSGLSKRMLCAGVLALAGCAAPPLDGSQGKPTPWEKASVLQESGVTAPAAADTPAGVWHHRTFPGKTPNQFAYSVVDGRHAMAVQSKAAASVWRKAVSVDPAHLSTLRFSWRKADLIPDADMGLRDKDDALRIVLAFDGDRSQLSARDHMLSELARALTGEEMPYATLMYVWSNQRDVGSIVVNPRTDRIRKLVLESGRGGLGQWLDYERDIRADYRQVFGEEPGRLLAVGLMTDTDNTRGTVQTWYGPLSFGSRPAALAAKKAP